MTTRFHKELDRLESLIADTETFSKLQESTRKYVFSSRRELRIKLGMDSVKVSENVLGFNDKKTFALYRPDKTRGLSPEYSEKYGYSSKKYKEDLKRLETQQAS